MISMSRISNWITETIGGYLFPMPEFPSTSPEERTSFQTPEIGSHQVAVLRDTESIPFEIPENNRMEVLDCNPDRGVKRLLDDDDETWSISRKKPKSPERKRIRLDDSPSPNATTRRFISKWNRSKQQLRKFQRRRYCVNISESVPMEPMELVEPSTSILLPQTDAIMTPVTQQCQQSNDFVLVDVDIVPRNRRRIKANKRRNKHERAFIYTQQDVEMKELDPIIARNTIEKMEIDPFVPKNRKKWRKRNKTATVPQRYDSSM
jgi:hypothetical protein